MEYPDFFENKEKIKSSMLWKRESASCDWRDGMLIGNGSLAAVSYAPGGLEWIINKTSVYDARYHTANLTPHKEMMELIKKRGDLSTDFIDGIEKSYDRVPVRSVSAAILRFAFGNGEMGWNAPAFPKVSEELELSKDILKTSLNAHFLHSNVKSLIPRGRDVLALRVEGITVCDKNHKLEIYRPYHDDMDAVEWHNGEDCELAFVQMLPGGGSYALALSVVPRTPDISRVSYALPSDYVYPTEKGSVSKPQQTKLTASVYSSGDVDVFVSVVSSRESKNPLADAVRAVKDAVKDGFEILERECAEWWGEYWKKSAVDFGEYTELERYWYFSAYELAVSFGKAPMPALAGMLYGPLNATVPGLNPHNYNTDQNTQIPVMPVPVINHAELIISFIETHTNAGEVLASHTRRLFGEAARGWFIPLVMNQDGRELPSGSYRYTMCGSAYVGIAAARVWEYTKDRKLMREYIFPLLRELINFYAYCMLHKGADGIYHLDYSVPPEIFIMTRDDTATLSMLKGCIVSALEFAELEKISDPDTELWADVLANFPHLAKRGDGAFWGGIDVPEEHFTFGTHILYPIFPSEQYLSEEDMAAGRKTLEYIDREAIERVYAGEGGWHFVHDWSWHLYYSVKARLGDNADVWRELPRFIDYFGKSNGLFTHNSIVIRPTAITEENHKKYKRDDEITADMTTTPPWYGSGKCATPNENSKAMTAPVIEGNSVFLLRATETLLQSFDGIVRVFPGVPCKFTGGFSGLLAKGGFEVSAYMKNGILTKLSVKANENGLLKLAFREEINVPETANISVENSLQVISLKLKKGEIVNFVN